MGIFDFAQKAQAKIAADQAAKMTDILKAKLHEYGLVVHNVHVAFDGGTVTIQGEAANRVTKEKVVLALGNLPGVHKVDDQMTLPAPPPAATPVAEEPESQFYTVVKGDTLSKIAKHYYGDAMKYPVIFEANKPMLKDPNLIFPGQVLRIPAL